MGTAFRNPGQVVSMLCDSANVAAGAVLVQGASNDTCALPSAANTRAKVIGIATRRVRRAPTARSASSSAASGPRSPEARSPAATCSWSAAPPGYRDLGVDLHPRRRRRGGPRAGVRRRASPSRC